MEIYENCMTYHGITMWIEASKKTTDQTKASDYRRIAEYEKRNCGWCPHKDCPYAKM